MKLQLIGVGFQALLDFIAILMAKYTQPKLPTPAVPSVAKLTDFDIENGTFDPSLTPKA